MSSFLVWLSGWLFVIGMYWLVVAEAIRRYWLHALLIAILIGVIFGGGIWYGRMRP